MSEESSQSWRDVHRGISMEIPAQWEAVEAPAEASVLCVVLGPVGATSFRPNAVLTVDDLDVDATLADWQRSVDVVLNRTLSQYQVIALQHLDAQDFEGARRLAHHAVNDAEAVTMVQYAYKVPGAGYSLTVSAATEDYLAIRASAESLGLSFSVATGPSAGMVRP